MSPQAAEARQAARARPAPRPHDRAARSRRRRWPPAVAQARPNARLSTRAVPRDRRLLVLVDFDWALAPAPDARRSAEVRPAPAVSQMARVPGLRSDRLARGAPRPVSRPRW